MIEKTKQPSFRDKSILTHSPLDNPKRIQVAFPAKDLDALKQHAFDNNTTVSEIIRVLVADYLKQQRSI